MCLKFVSRLRQIAIAVLVLCSLYPWQSACAERIRDFQVDMVLAKDGLLTVSETIKYDFERALRHGIYRRIPVSYQRNGCVYDLNLHTQSVQDGQGHALPYSSKPMDGMTNIQIGDARVLVTGVHTYRIKYDVRKAVNLVDKAAEVYWNCVGGEWPCAIDHVKVVFHPPAKVTAAQVRTTSYFGARGSTAHGQSAIAGNTIVFRASNLKPGQDFTIVAALPPGSVVLPTFLQSIIQSLVYWKVGVIIPAATLAILFLLWFIYGRDALNLQAVGVEWMPPTELTPAEVGTLIDEHCDNEDVTSTLLDLAARGYLIITQVPFNGLIGTDNKDYKFKKAASPDPEKLKPHEVLLLSSLFVCDDVDYLSHMRGHFREDMETMRNMVYQSLVKDQYFVRSPKDDRDYFIIVGAMALGLGGLLLTAGIAAGDIYKNYGFGIGLSGLLIMLASSAIPKRTAKGVQALRQCLAFKRFVKMAEKSRIEKLAADDPLIFGRLLPYATVLGCANNWAFAFKDLLESPPDFYRVKDNDVSSVWNSQTFTYELCRSLTTITTTFASAPLPTVGMGSNSGNSGFFGGSGGSGGGSSSGFGGSSGGGFGGGGGGSW